MSSGVLDGVVDYREIASPPPTLIWSPCRLVFQQCGQDLISLLVLFSINLLNYIDRFTIAGLRYFLINAL